MPKILLELSMSLDGYVTGPDVSPDAPMGRGGEGAARVDIRRSFGHQVPGLRGAVQELRLHVVPVVLGAGTRLFDDETPLKVRLRPVKAASTPLATHVTYEVSAAG